MTFEKKNGHLMILMVCGHIPHSNGNMSIHLPISAESHIG
jgi:hypothetical protein